VKDRVIGGGIGKKKKDWKKKELSKEEIFNWLECWLLLMEID
jgi:hypothetical protein